MNRRDTIKRCVPLIVALVILAAYFLAYKVRISYNVDECYTLINCNQKDWGKFVDAVMSGYNQTPPAYFAAVFALNGLFDLGVPGIRLFSVLTIAAGLALITLVASRSFGWKAATFGIAWMMLCSRDYFLEEITNARFYAAYCMFMALAIYGMTEAIGDRAKRGHLLCFAGAAGSLLTMYVAGIYGLALVAGYLGFCRFRGGFDYKVPLAFVLGWLLFVPFLPLLFVQKSVGHWASPPPTAQVFSVFNPGIKLSWLAALAAAGFLLAWITKREAIAVTWKKIHWERRQELILFMAGALVLVPNAMFLLSELLPELNVGRYYLPSVFGWYFLLCAAFRLGEQWLADRPKAKLAFTTLLAISLLAPLLQFARHCQRPDSAALLNKEFFKTQLPPELRENDFAWGTCEEHTYFRRAVMQPDLPLTYFMEEPLRSAQMRRFHPQIGLKTLEQMLASPKDFVLISDRPVKVQESELRLLADHRERVKFFETGKGYKIIYVAGAGGESPKTASE